MSKRKNTITAPVVLLMIVVFIIAAGYLLFNFYFSEQLAATNNMPDSEQNITAEKVYTDLPLETAETEQFFNLSDQSYSEYAEQVFNTSEYYPEPTLPDNIRVEDTTIGDSVFISWHQPYQQYYDAVEIYRSTKKDQVKDNKITEQRKLTGSYIDREVETGKKYYYVVRALRQVEGTTYYSDFSSVYTIEPTDTTAPIAPQNITVNQLEDNPSVLVIRWELIEDDDAKTVRIRRSTTPGKLGDIVEEVDVTINYLFDQTLDPGKTYYYVVTTVDKYNNESSTNIQIAPFGNSQPFLEAEQLAEEVLYPDYVNNEDNQEIE